MCMPNLACHWSPSHAITRSGALQLKGSLLTAPIQGFQQLCYSHIAPSVLCSYRSTLDLIGNFSA